MIFSYICYLDFETCSKLPYNTQPIQLAAVMIDIRRLEVLSNGIFNSYIKPIADEKAEEYGLSKIEKEALDISKISLETLKNSPSLKVVWGQFIEFIDQYNTKKQKWTAPILAGFNNTRFDNIIIDRICGGNKLYNPTHKEPYRLGPWDDEERKTPLFHPRDNIDLMKYLWWWFENDVDVKSISMDSMRNIFGISASGSHNALVDVLQGAYLLIKFLRLTRYVQERMSSKFHNSFEKENRIIAEILSKKI